MHISKKIKPDIMIRGLLNTVWQKFRIICKEEGLPSANYGVQKLIKKAVKQYEAEHGEVICNSKE